MKKESTVPSILKILIMKKFGKIGSKLLNINADPGIVSGSYALGVFLATTPFIGMKVFIALVLTPNDASLPDISEISKGIFFNALYGSWGLFRTLLAGGLILGIPLSLAAFFLSYMFLSRKDAGTPVVR
jgi:hypothetical protein